MKTSTGIHIASSYGKTPLKIYTIKKAIIPWLFLLPGIVFTLILRYYTTFQGLRLSFYKYDLQNPPGSFIGLKNFEFLFKNSDFWTAWRNTLIFLVLILLLNFFVPLIQALFLAEVIKLRGFFSTVYILPAVVPITINIILWKWIFDPTYGIANALLHFFGAQPQIWLSDLKLVKLCIIIPGIVGGGMGVLLYLAAILGLSEDVKEASLLDGCSGFKRILYIVLPNIKFIIIIQFILTTIGAFQLLDVPFQFTGGGPGVSATSVPVLVYNLFNKRFDYGQANAAAMTLMFVISLITYFQLKLENQDKG